MKTKSQLLIVAFSLLLVNLFAQIPTGYYNSAQGLTGAQLKTALHNIIKNHTSVSYASLWTHYQTTDKKSNGKVWDIYSDVPNGTPPYEFTFGTNQCGSYAAEGDCYNREHSWPQSWFNSATIPSSDMFHIYPTDGKVNGLRSNYSYGDVGTALWTSLNGSKLGFCIDSGYNQTVFEPIDEYKGDLARGYFYMSTRYEGEDAAWASSAGTNKATILPWQASVLLQWSHQDPVSAKEIARNNAIYQIQHNRNPYIDNPQWADSIWTIISTSVTEENVFETNTLIYPNPASNNFQISNTGNSDCVATISVYNMLGQRIDYFENIKLSRNNSSQFSVNCEKWTAGMYFISISKADKIKIQRFIKE